ncbi:double-strand break repair protein AddB [Pararhizobium mangrovi]|uniref:Double-strand break repair protein AddB n=1 Tax=Pararhizobium mangrovi TaxID=2590452 RepID=A0A506U704_9HYPH|nr:double-strand break repair protein AddB [Pararhizobium mangrovi]TPW28399.1 double-strand break repair protein AddB [Pararhizobium mangrovi]
MSGGRLVSIPPGVPFLKTLVDALCEGRLVDGFTADRADPLALATVTIFVPTRRAARTLRSLFVDRLGGGSAILPVIRPLGEIDDDAGFFEAPSPETLDLDPPVDPVERLLELARLILAWKAALPRAVEEVHGETPLIAPANPADALWLARGLADLMDEMETAGKDWSALETLEAADHAAWWQLTLEFLRIATRYWPERLGELARANPAAHRNAALRAQARRFRETPPDGPVVVAGSTGSLPATRDLVAAVAESPMGAVVLPGLDLGMRPEHWLQVGATIRGRTDDPATRAHPQYGLYALLSHLRVGRDAVADLAEPDEMYAVRNRLVSLAMLPSEATDAWAEPETHALADAAPAAFADVSLIEAAGERSEAQALAVAMRLALEEGEDHQVALVTPDRALARRVSNELRRFGIEADDSAGRPLGATGPGTIFRLAVEVALAPGDPVALLSLLKHPLARFGLSAGKARHSARMIELLALRGGTGEAIVAELTALLERRMTENDDDDHAPRWFSRIGPEARADARDLAKRVEAAVFPLKSRLVRHRAGDPAEGLTSAFSVAEWARATTETLEAICIDAEGRLDGLWAGEAGERLAELMASTVESRAGLEVTGAEWAAMLPALLAGETVKPRTGAHPRVFVWGALEARLQPVDTLLLAGLNEQSWPAQTANDAFLSRAMKTAIGLEPPERRIGQAAHDIQMGFGARRLVLSRAARAGGGPTVASRWLQRLLTVVGEETATAMRTRGTAFCDWAATLDTAESVPLASRPAPKPPRERQPKRYSFSEVGLLRRDPYAIYARRVLALEPIAELMQDPSFAARGSIYHEILENFARSGVAASDPEALGLFKTLTARQFDAWQLPAHIAAVWRPRFERVAKLFLEWESRREKTVVGRHVEAYARTHIPAAGVVLSGMADRIDLMADGTAEIIDYKTGAAPSAKQARTLLDPQLALEAGVLQHHGFLDVAPLVPSALRYVRLKPGARLRVDRVDDKKDGKAETRSASELGDAALVQFSAFVQALASNEHGFASRLIPASARDFGGEYDHLARVAEWSTAEEGDDGDDG